MSGEKVQCFLIIRDFLKYPGIIKKFAKVANGKWDINFLTNVFCIYTPLENFLY